MCKENRPATKNVLEEGCPKDAQGESDYEQDDTFDLFRAEEEDPEWEPLSILGKAGREVSIYFDPARVWYDLDAFCYVGTYSWYKHVYYDYLV
jgi:hypothetical protein